MDHRCYLSLNACSVRFLSMFTAIVATQYLTTKRLFDNDSSLYREGRRTVLIGSSCLCWIHLVELPLLTRKTHGWTAQLGEPSMAIVRCWRVCCVVRSSIPCRNVSVFLPDPFRSLWKFLYGRNFTREKLGATVRSMGLVMEQPKETHMNDGE